MKIIQSEQFEQALNGLNEACKNENVKFIHACLQVPAPKLLYHFTDGAGLFGILSTGKFRLSDATSLNDPTELLFGVKRGLRGLNKALAAIPTSREEPEKLRDWLSKTLMSFFEVFCLSFSKGVDDINLWRCYANDCAGFALEFDSKELIEGFKKSEDECFVNASYNILYGESELDTLNDRLLNLAMDLIPHAASTTDPRGIDYPTLIRIYKPIFDGIMTNSLFFKHTSYRGEDEYRFVQRVKSSFAGKVSAQLRERRYGIVKYKSFDWIKGAPTSLKRIIIGSGANGGADAFVDDCLREFSHQNVAVEHSDIPYRRV